MKQLSFKAESLTKPKDIFGGSLLKNSHAKAKRPLSSKLPIHLVLRANQGGLRAPKVHKQVNQSITRACRKYGVRLYHYANVGNHLHLLIKLRHINDWRGFIREVTGRVAQVAQSLGGRQKAKQNFWKQRPFTRLIRGWGKAYRTIKGYVELNWLEGEGHIKRAETKTLRDLRALLDFEDGLNSAPQRPT